MRHVPQQLSFFFKEIIHSIPNRFNCALIAHTWQFCFEARFFFPKALSKHRMGLAPDVVHVSSPEINGMGFAEPALDVDKVCSCWGSCLLCLCQRPATATAKGKDALSRLKLLLILLGRSSGHGPLFWHKQEHHTYFSTALPPSLTALIHGVVKFCIFFASESALFPALFWIQMFH